MIAIPPVLLVFFFSIIFYSGKFKQVKPEFKYINLKYTRKILSLGVKFFIIQLQVVIFLQSTNFLILTVSTPNDVSQYNIAYKYLSISMMLYNILMTPIWPAFTDAYAKNDYLWMNRIYRKLRKIFFISSILLIGMVIISQFFYSIWIGNNISIPFVMTLSVAIYVLLASWCSLQIYPLNGIGKVQLQTYVCLVGMFFHIPLSLVLGQFYGSLGVVFSLIIIHLIYAIIYTFQIKKILNKTASGLWTK